MAVRQRSYGKSVYNFWLTHVLVSCNGLYSAIKKVNHTWFVVYYVKIELLTN